MPRSGSGRGGALRHDHRHREELQQRREHRRRAGAADDPGWAGGDRRGRHRGDRRGDDVDWLDDLFADVLVRLYELELGRIPISAAEAKSFQQRYGDRRPDLVQRLRPLVDGTD